MNCWFYAAKTIVYQQTGRVLWEMDYMQPSWASMRPPHVYGERPSDWLAYGLPPARIQEFAERFHFARLSAQPASWTASELEDTLRRSGPLWFGGHRGRFNHVVVVSGVSADSNVLYGDPALGNLFSASLSDFNQWKTQTVGLLNPLQYVGG
jgi:hypothetical protein